MSCFTELTGGLYCLLLSPRTAFYALCLIARTKQGCSQLNQLGWLCLRHGGEQLWPVTEYTPQSSGDTESRSSDRLSITDTATSPYTPVFPESDHALVEREFTRSDKPNRKFHRHRHSLVIDHATVNDLQAHMPLHKSESLDAILDSGKPSIRIRTNSDQDLNVDKPSSRAVPKFDFTLSPGETEIKRKTTSLDSPKSLRQALETLGNVTNTALLYGRKSARPVSMLTDAEAVRYALPWCKLFVLFYHLHIYALSSRLYAAESPSSEKFRCFTEDAIPRTSSLAREGGYVGLTVPGNLNAFYRVRKTINNYYVQCYSLFALSWLT